MNDECVVAYQDDLRYNLHFYETRNAEKLCAFVFSLYLLLTTVLYMIVCCVALGSLSAAIG